MTKYSKIFLGILAAALCVLLLVPRAAAPSAAGNAEDAAQTDSAKSLDQAENAENADKTEDAENTYDTEPAELKEYLDAGFPVFAGIE